MMWLPPALTLYCILSPLYPELPVHSLEAVEPLWSEDSSHFQEESESFPCKVFTGLFQTIILSSYSIIIKSSLVQKSIQVQTRPFQVTLQVYKFPAIFNKQIIKLLFFIFPEVKLFGYPRQPPPLSGRPLLGHSRKGYTEQYHE